MKKLLFLLLAGLLLHHSDYAQKTEQQKIDSLLTRLAKSKEDTTRVNLYLAVMKAHVYYNTQEGLAYQKPALELAQKLNWSMGVAKVKDRAGRLSWRLGKFDDALKNHVEALNVYTQTGDKFAEGFVLIEIAQDYLDNGKYAEAETYLLKAVKVSSEAGHKTNMSYAYDIMAYLYAVQGKIAEETNAKYMYLKVTEEIGDKKAISRAAQSMGDNALNLGNKTDALKYYKQGLQAIEREGEEDTKMILNDLIAGIYSSEGNFAEAMHHYSTALMLAEQLADVQALADVHAGIANMYMLQAKYPEALTHYTKAAAGLKSTGNNQHLANIYAGMGTAYTYLKNYSAAKKSFSNSMLLDRGLKSNISLSSYYSGMALLDSATGNWKDAYKHYKEFIIIRDSSFNKEALKKMVASQMQYQADKKESVAKAVQEKKDVETQGEIRRQRNILYTAFGVLTLVLLFSVVVYMQRNKIAKEKQRSDALVQDKELLLREIHHRVKNNLEIVSSLLALQSAQIDDAGTKAAMQEGQNRVQSIGIVHQKLYQGTNLGSVEMKDYFLNLGESILDSFGAEEKVTIECAMEKLEVDIDTAVPLGLIVNELLTNTLKYAFPEGQKGTVQIKLEKSNGTMRLEVSDNGVGKSGETKGTGFGGQLIALLTRQLGGTMREVVENGTYIFFEFNVKV
ncbi:MAG: histidine kinase dimerization/phosphoacceptor domain -containing protein [Chitinophagaceae bacterium]